MFVYTIQPVVKPVVQPVWQPVASCKRGMTTPKNKNCWQNEKRKKWQIKDFKRFQIYEFTAFLNLTFCSSTCRTTNLPLSKRFSGDTASIIFTVQKLDGYTNNRKIIFRPFPTRNLNLTTVAMSMEVRQFLRLLIFSNPINSFAVRG